MDNDFQPNPPISTPPPVPAPQQKNKLKIFLLIIGFILTVAIIGSLAYFSIQQNRSAIESKNRIVELEKNITELQKTSEDKDKELEKRKETTGEENIEKDNFQAVFLKTGPVYFGKITKITNSQITLENIFYLQTDKTVASKTEIDQIKNMELIKLGNELHGPQDKMFIERKEVIFWENLKPDGEVTKAIREYESNN